MNGVIKYVENMSKALFEWFRNNLLKSNADKCHRLVNLSIKVSEYDASRHMTSFKRL